MQQDVHRETAQRDASTEMRRRTQMYKMQQDVQPATKSGRAQERSRLHNSKEKKEKRSDIQMQILREHIQTKTEYGTPYDIVSKKSKDGKGT